MKIDKLPSGSYRIRKTINKKVYQKTYDHKPTKKEMDAWVAELITSDEPDCPKGTFEYYARSYIKAKSNVLSQSTIRGYNTMVNKTISPEFLSLDLRSITAEDVQLEINRLAGEKSAKTVKNVHGFISPVLTMYRPSLVLRTTIPRVVHEDTYIPSDEDLRSILEYAKGKSYELAIVLGMHGLRESEAICVTDEDLFQEDGQYMLRIRKAKVRGPEGYVVQDFTKTDESYRTIPINEYAAKLLQEQKIGFAGYPTRLWHNLVYAQDKCGVEHFKFHALRHYFVSKAHSKGVPDAVIRKICGFSSNYVMNKHYKHALSDQVKNATALVTSDVLGNF